LVLEVCPDCGGQGLTVNPEVPLHRDQRCNRCMGGGLIDRPASTPSLWQRRASLALEAARLPFTALLHWSVYGRAFAWRMLAGHWRELREEWTIDTGEIPEAGPAWFARAKLPPSEPPKKESRDAAQTAEPGP
jgi:hypothetical protein